MKKTLIATFICIFVATATSYAGIFSNQTTNNNTKHASEGLFSSSPTYSHYEDNSGYGLFKSDPDNLRPGDRPDSGNGIGQTPIGDGLSLLITPYALLIVAKVIKKTFKRKSIQKTI